ncbi:MAG: hypothetical protein ACK4MQ_07480 [Hyphomonas sp.]
MNAVRKPADEKPDLPSDAVPAAPPAISPDALPRKASASPVHSLQARIEKAFTGPNERRTVRITTMLLVVALSTWVAALVMQAGA